MDNKDKAQIEKDEAPKRLLFDEELAKYFGFKRLLSVEELAEYLGLSPRTIYNGLTKKCKKPFPIRAKRIGKLVKFDLRDIERYIDSL